jgi:hypothetical protein
MFRKISFAVITAIALGAAAMSPASAGGKHGGKHGGHHGHGHGHGHGKHNFHPHFYGSSAFYIGGDCYRYIKTRRGLRLVNFCVY